MIEISYTNPVHHRRNPKERSVFTLLVIFLLHKQFLGRHNGFKFTRESQIEAMQLETFGVIPCSFHVPLGALMLIITSIQDLAIEKI